MNPIRPNLSSVILSLSLAVILGLLVVLNPLPAQAQTWSGGGANDNWTNGANWGGTAPISGNGLSFAGTTRLTPVNDFAEDTSFGAITFDSGAGAFTLSGNRITLTGNVTNSSSTLQTINLDMILGSTRTFSGDLAVGGILSGAGGLTAATPGTLTLTGANTYSGATTVSTGVLNIQNASALGTTAAGTTVNSGAALQIQGGITTAAEALTLNGTGVSSDGALRNISGTNTYAGLVTLGAAARINSDAGTLTLSNTGTITGAGRGLTVGGAGNTTIASAIGTGSGTLTKDGAGTLTLTRQNTFSGATTISAGTLAYGVSNALGTGSVTVSDTGILDLGADQSDNVGTVTLQGGGQINGSGTSTLTSTGSFEMRSGSVSAILAGAVPLNKTSSGTVTLSGANTYTGETTITLGTLQLGNGGTTGKLSTSSAIVNNGTLRINRSDAVAQGTDFTGAAITGTGALVHLGAGTTTLSAANTFTGTTTVSGGKVALTNPLALQNSAYVTTGSNGTTIGMDVSDPGALDSGKLTLGGLAGAVDLAGAFTAGFTGSVTNLTLNPQTGNSNTYSGVIANGAMTLTKTGAGIQTLSGANTYTGTTAINGGVLAVTNGAAIADTGAVVLADVSGATLTVENSETIGSLRGGGANGGNVTIASGQTLTVAETGSQTFAGIISDAGGLTKTAAGTLTLTGANTYTGGTTINGGTLALGSAGAIGSSGTIAFGGGTLQYSASNTTDYSDRFSNGASQQYSIDTNSQNVTLATALTSSGGSFTKLGAGTLALTGANTYDGATTVSAGALQVGSSGLGQTGTGAVTVQTGSTLLGTGLVQGSTFTLDNGGTLRPGDSLDDSSHGTLTFDPVSLSGDISLQGNIIMGISGATYFDATYGGNSLGSAGYNTWVDGISGVGTHDRLVFNENFLGYNVSFLNTTGGLEVVGNSFTPERGQVFNLMDWGGLINMNFTGFNFNNYVIGNGDEGIDLDLPDLSAFDLAWDMSRFTTSGNIVVIPEPSRALLMMVGLAGLALRRRRQVTAPHSHFALRGSTQ
jgi:autotransporter-associated beta strand protein